MNPLVDVLSAGHLQVSGLEAVYQRYSGSADFGRWAVSAVEQLDSAELWRPIWLLRRGLREGRSLAEGDLGRLIEMAEGFDHWIARLNFCQMMSEIEIPASLRDEAVPVLVAFADDRRAIIRAWAISSLYPFRNDLREGGQIRRLIARAKKDESKALRARLRRLEGAKAVN